MSPTRGEVGPHLCSKQSLFAGPLGPELHKDFSRELPSNTAATSIATGHDHAGGPDIANCGISTQPRYLSSCSQQRRGDRAVPYKEEQERWSVYIQGAAQEALWR